MLELIPLPQSLPCGLLVDDELCGQPAQHAYITPDTTDTVPDEGGYYRLLPVCTSCQQQLAQPPVLISDFDQSFTGRTNWDWS